MSTPILIVDTDIDVRSRCASALVDGERGQVFELDSGQQALELCRRHPVASLLVGEVLADAPGLDLLTGLSRTRGIPTVPAVFVSGSRDPGLEAEARNRGAQECIVKADLCESLVRLTVDTAIERHQLRIALREAEEKFRTLLDLSTEPITITRLADGRLIEVNRPFEIVSGYSRQDALGKKPLELGLWEQPGEHEKGLLTIEHHGILRDFETRFRSRDGRLFPGRISATVVTLDGEPAVLSFVRVEGETPSPS